MTDEVKYPRWSGELRVGDLFQTSTACDCILLCETTWYLNPCSEHEWKCLTASTEA